MRRWPRAHHPSRAALRKLRRLSSGRPRHSKAPVAPAAAPLLRMAPALPALPVLPVQVAARCHRRATTPGSAALLVLMVVASAASPAPSRAMATSLAFRSGVPMALPRELPATALTPLPTTPAPPRAAALVLRRGLHMALPTEEELPPAMGKRLLPRTACPTLPRAHAAAPVVGRGLPMAQRRRRARRKLLATVKEPRLPGAAAACLVPPRAAAPVWPRGLQVMLLRLPAMAAACPVSPRAAAPASPRGLQMALPRTPPRAQPRAPPMGGMPRALLEMASELLLRTALPTHLMLPVLLDSSAAQRVPRALPRAALEVPRPRSLALHCMYSSMTDHRELMLHSLVSSHQSAAALPTRMTIPQLRPEASRPPKVLLREGRRPSKQPAFRVACPPPWCHTMVPLLHRATTPQACPGRVSLSCAGAAL